MMKDALDKAMKKIAKKIDENFTTMAQAEQAKFTDPSSASGSSSAGEPMGVSSGFFSNESGDSVVIQPQELVDPSEPEIPETIRKVPFVDSKTGAIPRTLEVDDDTEEH